MIFYGEKIFRQPLQRFWSGPESGGVKCTPLKKLETHFRVHARLPPCARHGGDCRLRHWCESQRANSFGEVAAYNERGCGAHWRSSIRSHRSYYSCELSWPGPSTAREVFGRRRQKQLRCASRRLARKSCCKGAEPGDYRSLEARLP